MNSSTEQLEALLRNAGSVAVLTGAGISTASGIPDFRSAGGVYSDERNVNVFDLPAFQRDPAVFYRFARSFYPQVRDAEPNAAHRALAEWQRKGLDVTVITQNVDDYHQRAGSDPVYTVHGNFIRSTCRGCGAQIETEVLFPIIERGDIPHCSCGGVYKPNITFFGEMLPEADWTAAVNAISRADLVLVLGTSLTVYPAASLPAYRPTGSKLVIINRDSTSLDGEADLVVNGDLCATLSSLSVCRMKDAFPKSETGRFAVSACDVRDDSG